MASDEVIFKVCSRNMWETAVEQGIFSGAEIDLADGFIHFSAAHQVEETVAKHFGGQADLVLICVPSAVFGAELKWEVSRNGDRFPHLYGVLQTDLATRIDPLPLGANGIHQFPADLQLADRN